jgi:hypothetical protein
MNNLITVILILFPAFLFGLMGKTVEMSLIIVASSICGAYLNIDKIHRFKGAGFEAEMKKNLNDTRATLNETQATLKNLKEMALPLIISSMNSITYLIRWGGLTMNKIHQIKNKLEEISKEFEIKDDSLNEIFEDFERLNTWDILRMFLHELSKRKTHQINNNYLDESRIATTNYYTKEEILKIINISEIDLTERELELLKAYVIYKEEKKLPIDFSDTEK